MSPKTSTSETRVHPQRPSFINVLLLLSLFSPGVHDSLADTAKSGGTPFSTGLSKEVVRPVIPAPTRLTRTKDPDTCRAHLFYSEKVLGIDLLARICEEAIFGQDYLALVWNWDPKRSKGIEGFRIYKVWGPADPRRSLAFQTAAHVRILGEAKPAPETGRPKIFGDLVDTVSFREPKPATVSLLPPNPRGIDGQCFVVTAFDGKLESQPSKRFCIGKEPSCGEVTALQRGINQRRLDYLQASAIGEVRYPKWIQHRTMFHVVAHVETGIFPWGEEKAGPPTPAYLTELASASSKRLMVEPKSSRPADLSKVTADVRRLFTLPEPIAAAPTTAQKEAVQKRFTCGDALNEWRDNHFNPGWVKAHKADWWRLVIECEPICDPGKTEDNPRCVSPLVINKNDSDFGLNGVIRFVYLYRDRLQSWGRRVPGWVVPRLERQLLDYKYWLDEEPAPNPHTGEEKTYWSENHQILYATAEYLAGQYFQKRKSSKGQPLTFRSRVRGGGPMTGADRMAHARPRVLRWLNHRLEMGFSEWNSPGYYQYNVVPLLNLIDFAADREIRERASMVLDLLLFDLARFSVDGNFGGTAGRAYAEHKMSGWNQSIGETIEIVFASRSRQRAKQKFGVGCLHRPDAWSHEWSCWTEANNDAATALATSSSYCAPSAILAVGQDPEAEYVDRSRVSINFDEARDHGIGFDRDEDGIFWWGHGAYATKQMISTTKRLREKYGLQNNEDFDDIKYVFNSQFADVVSPIVEGMALTRANLYTQKMKGVMLSSVQSFRKIQMGPQLHPWQVTIDNVAAAWSTYPSSRDSHNGPNHWTGNHVNPRVVQRGPAAIIQYAPTMTMDAVYRGVRALTAEFQPLRRETHVWLPEAAFDRCEIHEQHGSNIDGSQWFLCAKGDSYVGVYSGQRCAWVKATALPGLPPDLRNFFLKKRAEITCGGLRNVFIVQIGNKDRFGSFEGFVKQVRAARINVSKGMKDTVPDSLLRLGLKFVIDRALGLPVISTLAGLSPGSLIVPDVEVQTSYDVPGGKRLSVTYDRQWPAYDGKDFEDDNFPRYENPYANVKWRQKRYSIRADGYVLEHDQGSARRFGDGVTR